MPHPNQPIVKDPNGMPRYQKNAIVKFLLDQGPFDMNALAVKEFSDADRAQFAQLIGYSKDGWDTLSYVNREQAKEALEHSRTTTPMATAHSAGSIDLGDGQSVTVLVDPLANAPFGIDTAFLERVAAETDETTTVTSPYGHLLSLDDVVDGDTPSSSTVAVPVTSRVALLVDHDMIIDEALTFVVLHRHETHSAQSVAQLLIDSLKPSSIAKIADNAKVVIADHLTDKLWMSEHDDKVHPLVITDPTERADYTAAFHMAVQAQRSKPADPSSPNTH